MNVFFVKSRIIYIFILNL